MIRLGLARPLWSSCVAASRSHGEMRKYAGQAKAGLARQRASEESMDSKPAKTEPVPLRQGFASGDKTYSESLNLPNTPFDIRANADAREKYFQKRSTEALYRWQSRQTDRPLFVLHDGPPYANGPLHLGHTVNKILKDIINRYQLLRGNRIHYIPGWDCHGLPIEQKVTSTLTLPQRSAENVRLVCKGEAWKAIRDQRDSFKMYGIMADWSQETTYRTLDRDYEIRQSKIFGEMVRRGLIYRAHRPVYWSPSSQTALAEAEIEHNPDYHSRTVYVNFLLQHGEGLKKAAKGSGLAERYLQEAANGQKTIFAPIWTTTPWSLVSNMALTINPDLDYSLVEVEEGALAGQLYIVASDLILKFEQIKLGLSTTGSKDRPQIGRTQPVMRFKGSALLDSTYRHPFLSSEAKGRPILAAAYVSADAGTGLVHCAPAHGAEDYQTWQAYCRTQPEAKAEGLLCPIDHQGAYTDEVVTIFQNAGVETYEPLPGTTVLGTGGKLITRLLDRYHFLIGEKPIQHSTPHDWRTKKPLIVRATSQWFANLEPIKERAIAALDKVNFTPKTGRARLETLIRKRDEWCISRQRPWGVPIPVLYNAENDEPLLSLANVQHIAQILEEKGTDYWWQGEADEFVAPQEQRDGVQWIKGTDTMDVWFDSGTSWSLLPGSEQDSTSEALFSSPSRSPADVYLEGTDQHRGWFQSSLLTYVATSASTEDSIPPYRNVITHGFTVDRKGKKMSKSEGNVISPLFYLKGGAKKKETAYGADVVRWWVATTDYAGSIASSPLQIKHASDNLRKIRNSFRFLLANLPLPGEVVSFADDGQLTLMERYMLLKTQELSNECKAAYDKFDFAQIISLVGNFTTSTLSSFYLDLSKDILYANHRDSKERQGVIYVLDQILKTMLSVVGPITPHLTEEVFHFYLGAKHDPKTEEETDRSVFHGTWHDLPVLVDPNVLEAEMSGILQMRTALAPLLQQAKEDGKLKVSLEGQVTISPQQMPHSPSESPTFDLLAKYESEVARILGVSRFEIVQQGKESQIETETGPWRYEGNYDGVSIVLEPCREHRCPRCWTYRMQEPKDRFCSRCKQVLEEQTAP